jgi:hypothetical protein
MKSHSIEDYQALGKSMGFTWTEEFEAPQNIYTPTFWTCDRCGREYGRTWHRMKIIKKCRCFSHKLVQPEHYRELARALKITWLDTFPARLTTLDANWRGVDGVAFRAPYKLLAGRIIPVRYRPHVDPSYRAPANYTDEMPLHVQALRDLNLKLDMERAQEGG